MLDFRSSMLDFWIVGNARVGSMLEAYEKLLLDARQISARPSPSCYFENLDFKKSRTVDPQSTIFSLQNLD